MAERRAPADPGRDPRLGERRIRRHATVPCDERENLAVLRVNRVERGDGDWRRLLLFPVEGSDRAHFLRSGARGDEASDRGGAQEDDRTGGYRHCADEILSYSKKHGLRTKVIFINDGPGLLLGSMWNDYVALEKSKAGKIMVATLRMVPERMTREWLES